MMIEAPQSFVVREECQKAASQNGFGRILGEEAGWAAFGLDYREGLKSVFRRHSTVRACDSGPRPFRRHPGEGCLRPMFSVPAMPALLWEDFLGTLYAVLHRVYELGVSLPDAPLREFELRVADLPRTTEAERLVVQRIGQDIFRARSNGLLAGTLPPHRHFRRGLTARLAHHPMGGLRKRCRAARRT